jgi:hypothetical protein
MTNRTNRVDDYSKNLLKENTIMIMRDKHTKMPLGVSFTEEGLRLTANKMGIYQYCEGRVRTMNEAKIAKRNPNVIIERFIPRDYPNNPRLTTAEILWVNKAKYMLGK